MSRCFGRQMGGGGGADSATKVRQQDQKTPITHNTQGSFRGGKQ
jgi:hypothetical protein